jgi:hypothetical protein
MNAVITLLPIYAFMAWRGTTGYDSYNKTFEVYSHSEEKNND